MTERKPRDLLADKELIGFTRCHDSGDQVVHRASSAKVTTKPTLGEKPEPAAASPLPGRDKG